MKTFPILFIAFALMAVSACNPAYLSQDFSARTSDHETIAVLPVEMVYMGMTPEGLTEFDMQELEVAEGKAFQMALHNEILRSTRKGRKAIRVKLQDVKQTEALLHKHDIALHQVENYSPEELADILGVDAVVRARIQKNRLMSDLTSYGIEMSTRAIGVLTKQSVWPWLPAGATRSKEIQASYALVDGSNGATLWSVAFDVEADWRQRTDDIIEQVTRRGARKFPYRDGDQLVAK